MTDRLPSEPHEPSPPSIDGETSSEDRNWAMAAHLGAFVTAWFALGLVAPLIVLIVRGNQSPFVRRHAVESLNFQINAAVITVVLFLTIFIGIGLILLPLYGLFYLIFVIRGGVAATNGQEFQYPATIRFVS